MRSLSTGLLLFCLTSTGIGVTQASAAPTMTLDKTTLSFGALTSGSTFALQTSTQVVRLTQGGAGTVTWTAAASQPWLVVTPASGSGTGTFRISIAPAAGLPAAGVVTASITVSYVGAETTTGTIGVTLTLKPFGGSAPPFGFVDTPQNNAAGLSGAVAFTGWALDDVEVAAVSVCRVAVAPETPSPDTRCGGAAQIYVGDAVFIEGARPDVQVGYPTHPRNSQAGWGLMVLTNMLPAQGNGTYSFSMWARDVEGVAVLLGTRILGIDNAHATLPWGTIDTPGQGETVSGNSYVNFGWALTQNPKFISTDVLTLMVYVDGQPVGPPAYGYYRSDIATFFPGLANSDTAIGFRVLDTTALSNGLHTIVWTATDSGNFTEGLGSRYFTVSNGSAVTRSTETARTAPAPAVGASTLASTRLDATSVQGRRGWAEGAAWRTYAADAAGRIVVHGEELDRFELQLDPAGAAGFTGYQRVGSALQPLPVGSRLAPGGRFTWSPGVGFVGAYDLVFVRATAGRVEARQEVRIILRPKSTGAQVVIDTPTARAEVGQPFVLAGWAADLAATEGTGIDTLHVWAYPLTGGSPRFLGVASGGTRPDVAAAYGDQFRDAGYGLMIQGLDPGTYDLAVFGWSGARGGFAPATVVRVTVR